MITECVGCKQKFEISDKNTTHKKKYKINGQSIFLTYYDCPSCGRRHYVQIDDEVSLRRLNENKRQFVTLAIAKKKGKEISKKQLAKFKKSREDLSDYRINLMKQYSGESVYDEESKTLFELRFLI